MNQGSLEEAKRTFLTCANIPDENLKDPNTHKSSVTSCLYNLGKLLHEQGQQEVGPRSEKTTDSNSTVNPSLINPRPCVVSMLPPQEALSIYKEAVQKMPRQFAPHSLFNMMGESTPDSSVL